MANLTCIVCGRTSNRTTWNNMNVGGTGNVACDFHSVNLMIDTVFQTPAPTASPLKINKPITHHESPNS
jgi:hypothetical protein